MNTTKSIRKTFVGLTMALLITLTGATIQAQDAAIIKSGPTPQKVQIYVGQSLVVETPWPTTRVSITDPKIADIQVLTPTQILLQGKSVGVTDLIAWSEGDKDILQLKVDVIIDIETITAELKKLFPDANLELIRSNNTVVVKGLFHNAEQVPQMHSYLKTSQIDYVDMTSVAGIQQVKIDVRIAEVTRASLRALGINAFHANEGFFGGSNIGSSSGGALNPSVKIGPVEGQPIGKNLDFLFNEDVSISPLVTVFAGFPDADLEIFLQALAENQYLRILANPTLIALNGEEASFLAGGEFPIPVAQSGAGAGGGGTAITIEYREFGVRLKFKPIVLGDNTIQLHVAPEVSDLTDVGAVEIQGFRVPGVVTRRSETTVELKSGQTFAMAGLLQRTTDARNTRVPGIGDLPVLGALFRSTRYVSEETEMVVLVSAGLVEPINHSNPPIPGLLHSMPNDWEFFSQGRIDGKEPAKISQSDAVWFKEAGLNMLVGPGAWEDHDQKPVQSQASAKPDFLTAEK